MKLDTFEILVGDMRGLRWVPFSGRLNVGALGYKHVEGGNENDGTPLYIVKAPYKGSVYPGKTSEKLEGTTLSHFYSHPRHVECAWAPAQARIYPIKGLRRTSR